MAEPESPPLSTRGSASRGRFVFYATTVFLASAVLLAPYAHLVDELVLGYLGTDAAQARFLFAGGGAYTLPRAVRELAPQASVTVVEIDPVVTATAEEHLYVSTDGMRAALSPGFHCGEARAPLSVTKSPTGARVHA